MATSATATTADRDKIAARSILRASLRLGALYMGAVSAAHLLTLKYPCLHIYWDCNFYAYQDRLLGVAAAMGALVLNQAASDPEHLAPVVSHCSWVAVVGLSLVNVSPSLASVMNGYRMYCDDTRWYWVQTAAVAGAAVWLAVWRRAAGY